MQMFSDKELEAIRDVLQAHSTYLDSDGELLKIISPVVERITGILRLVDHIDRCQPSINYHSDPHKGCILR